ncbi:MAG: pentapeptide repeat-containing protein [Candidatus Korobacteraceae bacterium]
MIPPEKRDAPGTWKTYISGKPVWLLPFLALEWPFDWLAFALSRWSFLEVLQYLGSFSVLVAVIFYFSEAGDRLKQKHYQAWQVINTAQHMGGSGGRIEALAELNADRVPLVGVDVSSAFLQGVQLPKARLLRANFSNADVRNSNLESADLSYSSLNGANFRLSNLQHVSLVSADLSDGDFCGARLNGANLSDATLDDADLGNADLSAIKWQQIKSVKKTNLAGVKNAPEDFLSWALKNGAVQLASNPNCPVTGGNP